MTELFAPTLADEIACVEREIALRRHVYPRWVAAKRMTREKADREIALMEAVARRLLAMQGTGG